MVNGKHQLCVINITLSIFHHNSTVKCDCPCRNVAWESPEFQAIAAGPVG